MRVSRSWLAVGTLVLLLAACTGPLANKPALTATPEVVIQMAAVTPTVPPANPPGRTSTPEAERAVRIAGVTANAPEVGRNEKLELTLDVQARFQNPFDPAQIDVEATFTGPSGQATTVPGFYWQDYSSTLNSGKEALTAQGQPAWKVRFTPRDAARWTYTVHVTTPDGTATSATVPFSVTTSPSHGFLRVDRRDHSYFAFDDGTPYLAIGQNVGWYGNGGTYDYAHWFDKMHANGANFARVWMASWALGIEWSDTGLGDYTKRLDRAWQLDRVFELAAQDHLYLMLSLLNHGAWSTSVNPEWDKNPYNAALGGPCKVPLDFATNQQARELFKRRLRYIAARWGYSPNLLAWEWWNEVDWTTLADTAVMTPWIKEMSTYLKTVDPYSHLRTTSYGKSGDDQVFAMPEIDIVQRHIYEATDPSEGFPLRMRDMRNVLKPALYGEFGSGADGGDDKIDRSGVHIHDGLWAGLMVKSSGTGMSWWWDNYVDPLDLYHLFRGPATFFEHEDVAGGGYRAKEARVDTTHATALVLQSPHKVLGWVKNKDYSYRAMAQQYNLLQLQQKTAVADFTPTFSPINGANISITGVTPGNYKVEWWSTQGEGVQRTETIAAPGDTLKLPVPSFTQDLAFKIVPANEAQKPMVHTTREF